MNIADPATALKELKERIALLHRTSEAFRWHARRARYAIEIDPNHTGKTSIHPYASVMLSETAVFELESAASVTIRELEKLMRDLQEIRGAK